VNGGRFVADLGREIYTKIEIKKTRRNGTRRDTINNNENIISIFRMRVAENVHDSNGDCRRDVYEPPHEHVQWDPLSS